MSSEIQWTLSSTPVNLGTIIVVSTLPIRTTFAIFVLRLCPTQPLPCRRSLSLTSTSSIPYYSTPVKYIVVRHPWRVFWIYAHYADGRGCKGKLYAAEMGEV